MPDCCMCESTLSPPYIKCSECVFLNPDSLLLLDDEQQQIEMENLNHNELEEIEDHDHDDSRLLDNENIHIKLDDNGKVDGGKEHSESSKNSIDAAISSGAYQLEHMFICPICFSSARTIGVHDASHKYEPIRDDFPVMPGSTWTATEEMTLLEAIQTCGLGSWQGVAKYLPGRTARDCEKHYFAVFLSTELSASLPGLRDMPSSGYRLAITYKHVVSNLPPRPAVLSAAYNEISGYMAARGDFVTEYDNHAELIVRDIDFTEELKEGEEAPWYLDLRLAVVDIYRYRVFERERRKRIIKQHGLLNPHATDIYFSVLLKWFSNSTVEALRKCMRLFTPEEFIKYIEGLKVEMKLRQQISRLSDCRKEGLTRLHQVRIFDKLSMRRADTKRRRISLESCIENLQSEDSWQRYMMKSSVADKIGTGAALPHPALGRKKAGPLEIHSLPGYEKINAAEKELCSVARLVPSAYLDFKRLLVNECRKEGCLKLARARTLIKIDVNKTRKIYDFLLEHNIINQDPL